MRALSLAASLFIFWLLLSGHYDSPWLIGVGIVSAVVVTAGGFHFGYIDSEGHPAEWFGHLLIYWPWLAKEIALSAVHVAGVIVNPARPIAPRLMRIPFSQKDSIGVVTYANSITLTPGTITVDVSRRAGCMIVHALTKSSAEGLATGEMDRRVARLEGR